LSAFSEENVKADAKAFAAVMRHIRQVDGKRHTVVIMRVENESGVMPVSRNCCALAEAAFAKAVPGELMTYLVAHKGTLIPELKEVWTKTNLRKSSAWREVFGDGAEADEVFQAWQIGRYIGRLAAAGKAEYAIPMYADAWLVQHKGQVLGQYPSGGPVARMMDVWRAAAPGIDLLAPDIYLDDFKGVCIECTQNGNPLFIPEASRDDRAGRRAMYALGHHHALGFAPFGIDSLSETNLLRDYYTVLGRLLPLIAQHQGRETLNGFLQYQDEKRSEFDIGDFRAEIEYRSEKENRPGGGIVVAVAPDTFVMTGSGYSIRFAARRDKPGGTAWLSIDELVPPGFGSLMASSMATFPVSGLDLVLGRRLNGDEAWYRVSLGARQRILLGRVYRFR